MRSQWCHILPMDQQIYFTCASSHVCSACLIFTIHRTCVVHVKLGRHPDPEVAIWLCLLSLIVCYRYFLFIYFRLFLYDYLVKALVIITLICFA